MDNREIMSALEKERNEYRDLSERSKDPEVRQYAAQKAIRIDDALKSLEAAKFAAGYRRAP